MKLITFAVPCYNSAAYMEKCINSILAGGDDIEIILIDDGSTKDETPQICDRYAAEYPDIVRVIHQENGGHGEGVNQGLRNASGHWYKVVDSDDWLDEESLRKVLNALRDFYNRKEELDLMICNYVYEHVEDNTHKSMGYKNVFPVETVFSWQEMRHFHVSQYLLMHSVIYRTELLRESRIELPKHTFYVDNIFVYYPLPRVKSIYYMDVDLYRYFIGREDQSVNEKIMVQRVDQQLLVTRLMFGYYNLAELKKEQPKLAHYMFRYLSMMLSICTTLLNIDGSGPALAKKKKLWADLKQEHPELKKELNYDSLAALSNLPTSAGRHAELFIYHTANKIFKFN